MYHVLNFVREYVTDINKKINFIFRKCQEKKFKFVIHLIMHAQSNTKISNV